MSHRESRDPEQKARGTLNLHLALVDTDTKRAEGGVKAMRARVELIAELINILQAHGVTLGIEIERIQGVVSQTTSLKEFLRRELDTIGELLERIQKSIQ